MNLKSHSSNALDQRFYNPWSCDEGFLRHSPVFLVVKSNYTLKACKKYVKTLCPIALEWALHSDRFFFLHLCSGKGVDNSIKTSELWGHVKINPFQFLKGLFYNVLQIQTINMQQRGKIIKLVNLNLYHFLSSKLIQKIDVIWIKL